MVNPLPSSLPPKPSPSPAYVPRNASRPSSPALSASYTPRTGLIERRGSGLRNEIHEGRGESSSNSSKAKLKATEASRAVLKMLSNLPAPLPETLPPKFLSEPSPSSSSSPSPPPPTTPKSFSDYVQTTINRKRSNSPDSEPEDGEIISKPSSIGLGLGLSIATPEIKRRRISVSPPRSKTLTPRTASPGLFKKEVGKSGLRNEIDPGKPVLGMESWDRAKWAEMGQQYRLRALLLKRHGDAYLRNHGAHSDYTSVLPEDPVRGLLCLTDCSILFLYCYWCEEQASGRVRSSPYTESQPLRDVIRRAWESEAKRATDEEDRERAKAMIGLMYLIEAVVVYTLNMEQLAHLSRRGYEMSKAASTHGPSPSSTTSASPPNTAGITQPSPAARSTSSSNSNSNSNHPESTSTTSASGSGLPPDILPLINQSTSSANKAGLLLTTSRHHLSLRILRTRFPETFHHAVHNELSDEALPIPGDNLGAAKKLDIDRPNKGFCWPIELGMWNPVAHVSTFGRAMVAEYAEEKGLKWEFELPGWENAR